MRQTAELYRPPRRLLPSEAAEQFLRNDKGPWDPYLSPMMIEPMNQLSSRKYTGIVFVGPARSSKTYSLLLGGITYVVTCAPGDFQVTHMSQDMAREFSRTELDRCIRHSDELKSKLSPRARDDNIFDKYWRSGIALRMGWPSVSQHSGKTLQYIFLTDYDRPENREDVDGEGPLWDLAQKRVETYMSRGKCVAESSPGEELMDATWRPISPHEAPPVPGIMSLYNRGTRARWYWPCKECNVFFEARPGIEAFTAVPPFEECEQLVKKHDPMTLADRFAFVACQGCGAIHKMEDRFALNAKGLWVHEGEKIEGDKVVGTRRRSNIASYWLGGVAATYQRWDNLLLKYFQGIHTFVRSGDEQQLKATTMTDLGSVYLARQRSKMRAPEDLMSRVEQWERGVVPPGVRFLTTSVDVQAHKFVVQVHGWGVGLETWLIDRFDITGSKREEAPGRMAAIDPASYLEDWKVLIDEVINRQYALEGHPQVKLFPHGIFCDSGGREGVTMQAYEFYRLLRQQRMVARFHLVKGDGRMNAPRTTQIYPDSRQRKDRKAGSRGDVPVWLLNVNQFKDAVSNDVGRNVPGPGYVHWPTWIESAFFNEMVSEMRTPKGWEAKSGARNEAFDLHTYGRAGCTILKAEQINWEAPPEWATDPVQRKVDAPAERIAKMRNLGRMLNG